jgi:hypothetical protein
VTIDREADPGLVFLGELELAFDRAREAAGGRIVPLEIGGVGVELAFAGDGMEAALLPPIEHLVSEREGDSAMRISIFDSASTGIEAPALPWRPPPGEPGKNPVVRYETDECCLLASVTTGSLAAVDLRRGEAIFHLPDPAELPSNERSTQLRETLHLLLSRRDRWLTHAGAVGRDGRGVLVVGRGGSGKSTLCLSCARAGMEIAADDYVALERNDGTIAHALLSTAKVTRESAALLGIGDEVVAAEDFIVSTERIAKAEVDLERIAPGRFRPSLQIVAVVAPVIADADAAPRIERVDGPRGLRALAPSTIMQTRTRGPSALPVLANLAREVPCFYLSLSTAVGANAEAVAELLDGQA